MATGRRPTSATAPATAQTASGRRKGRAMTPAVARPAMPQAATVAPVVTGQGERLLHPVRLFRGDLNRVPVTPRHLQRSLPGALADLLLLRLRHGEEEHRTAPTAATPPSVRKAALYPAYTTTSPASAGRQCRANALCSDDRALRDIEAAGAAHQVGDDDRKDRAVDAGADAVEKLHADQPVGIIGKGVEATRESAGSGARPGTSGLRPQASAFAPTSIAIGTITNCAATMQADIRLVPRFLF